MSSFIELPGDPLHAPAELEKLRSLVGARVLEVQAIHYVHATPSTSVDELRDILPQPASGAQHNENAFSKIFYVVPRNISPWSSRATSILQVCHVPVHRVERGRVIRIMFDNEAQHPFADYEHLLYDRMTEIISEAKPDVDDMFREREPAPLEIVDIFAKDASPIEILKAYNQEQGLALDQNEMEYLIEKYKELGRPPHDVELFMFAQVNSEHCRHKQFNANWTIDGLAKDKTLFGMIRNTHKLHPKYTVSAYSDNAAVLEGVPASFFAPDYSTGSWKATKEQVHTLIKVETHNHPTAISPFPGAATGSGGEIRDEGAVGKGSCPKAGLCGFWTSDLLIPNHKFPWEQDVGKPAHYASSLDIMLEAPIGSARFNNEFGRPNLTGSFKTLTTAVDAGEESPELRGYHKPIMIAGGHGTVRPQHAIKKQEDVPEGAHVIVLGGPAMLIGLGGGAASSNATGEGSVELDFNSVQRGNPEMQRRAQMVIDACTALGDENPIAMIHDVGAGGISNALPELVKDAGFGGHFELRQVHSADKSLSPLQIWCCEAQERYVLLVHEQSLNKFTSIANRERCSFSDVGRAVGRLDQGQVKLVLTDRDSKDHPTPIDLPMDNLFPKNKKLERIVTSRKLNLKPFNAYESLKVAYDNRLPDQDLLVKATERVLALPAVGSKSFLITIGDRTVKGLTIRDQMVGPWQTPVADVAVTATALQAGIKTGDAMCMGDKASLALISPAASARMAVAESLLNLGAAELIDGLARVRLSANWMADINHPGEAANLYAAVEAIGMSLCPDLGVSIPVGKDSLSMRATWKDPETQAAKKVVSPMTVIISAFAPVANIRETWTPALRRTEEVGETTLFFVDLAMGKQAMGASALAQVFGQLGDEGPDVRDVDLLRDYYDALTQLHESGIVLAYHDRSDGGLMATIAEMMFAGRCGAEIMLDEVAKSSKLPDVLAALFNEELGAVFQVRKSDETNFKRCFATCGPPKGLITKIGRVPAASKQKLSIRYGMESILSLDRSHLQQTWSSASYYMQRHRDNPACADEEYAELKDDQNPGLSYQLTFDPKENILPIASSLKSVFAKAPRVAILREQGVNGHAEMAFAFKAAGFDAIDVHMKDLIDGYSLADFVGIAACGGFSYGDVLGAGVGWGKSILHNDVARREFKQFFERTDTFALGVCNGCQMLSQIAELIPGTKGWPKFKQNLSAQFEGRLSMVEIQDDEKNPSIFLNGMTGSKLPIVVSHGEGRAQFATEGDLQEVLTDSMAPIRYVDNYGKVTTQYPANPNGSPEGIAGVRSRDGRVLALMPHPERTILSDVVSWAPKDMLEEWGDYGPWIRMFKSARRWVG